MLLANYYAYIFIKANDINPEKLLGRVYIVR